MSLVHFSLVRILKLLCFDAICCNLGCYEISKINFKVNIKIWKSNFTSQKKIIELGQVFWSIKPPFFIWSLQRKKGCQRCNKVFDKEFPTSSWIYNKLTTRDATKVEYKLEVSTTWWVIASQFIYKMNLRPLESMI